MSSKRQSKLDRWRLLFRVEADAKTGMGHLSRVRSIAHGFATQYACKLFFALGHKEIAQEFLRGLDCEILDPNDIFNGMSFDIVFADIPNLSLIEQQRLHTISKLLVGIDDESPGPFFYDILIRPNLLDLPLPTSYERKFHYWKGKDYIILHPEFAKQFTRETKIRTGPLNLLVCFGGSDPANLSLRIASILKELYGKIRAQIILGPAFSDAEQIRDLIGEEPHISLIINCQNMAQVFSRADLAMISGGTLLYEGAALGVPMIVLAQNKSQHREAEIFAIKGAAINLGLHDEITDQDIFSYLERLIKEPERLEAMSTAGLQLVSPHGTRHIIKELVNKVMG